MEIIGKRKRKSTAREADFLYTDPISEPRKSRRDDYSSRKHHSQDKRRQELEARLKILQDQLKALQSSKRRKSAPIVDESPYISTRSRSFGVIEDKQKLPKPLSQCLSLVKSLSKHKFAWPFMQPVDAEALGLKDYFEKVKEPMDFGTIKNKLENNEYTTIEEFDRDANLVFNNCFIYNKEEHDVFKMGESVQKEYIKKFDRIKNSPVPSIRKAATPKISRQPKAPQPIVAPSPEPESRPLTLGEKKKLKDDILKLTSEDLPKVFEILVEGKEVPKTDTDVELDLDSFEPRILKNLQNFVAKKLSKRRQTIRQSVSSAQRAAPSPRTPALSSPPMPTPAASLLLHQESSESSSSSSESSDNSDSSSGTDSEPDVEIEIPEGPRTKNTQVPAFSELSKDGIGFKPFEQ